MKHLNTTLLTVLLSSTLSAQPPSFVPTTGLIAWYPFSGNALDESGNGHDLTVNGATLAADRNGQANSAYQFNGSNAHMNGGSHPDFEITGSRTVSVWARNGTTFTIDQGIVAYHPTTAPLAGHPGYDLRRRYPGDGYEKYAAYEDSVFCCWGGPYGAVLSDEPYAPGVWHHLVSWRSGSTTWLYVDGVLQSDSYELIPRFEGSELLVGWTGSTGQFYDGEIDDIGIWDRALTPTEIEALFSAGGPGDCLIASYPFDGNANDMTGNGHEGTVYGATIATDRFGNDSSCYQFDGVDDFIKLDGILTGSNGTVSAWIYPETLSQYNPIFSRRDTTMNGNALELVVNSAGGQDDSRLYNGTDLRDCVGGSSLYFTNSDPMIVPAVWTHVAMSADDNGVHLFINCEEVTTYGDNNTGLWFDDMCPLSISTYIGMLSRPINTEHFIGRIDDLRVYNCALSAEEIAALCDINTATVELAPPTGIRAYPNPTTGQLRLSNISKGAVPQVFDATGRKIQVATLQQGNEVTIDLSAYPIGLYIVRIAEHSFSIVRQ